jgi:hypothetical protein
MNGEEIDFKTIMRSLKGAKARLIIQLSSIWIAGGRFGCIWKVVRGRFEVTKPTAVDFIEDSDVEVPDEDETEDSTNNLTEKMSNVTIASKTTVVESSEEEEDDNENDDSEIDEPPPPPPPPATKKKTTKK